MARHLPTRKRYTTRQTQRDLEELGQEFEFFDPRKPLRHSDQIEHDRRVRLMTDDWLTQLQGQALRVAPHLGPRGMNQFVSYQNAVFQALMHVPIFLQWISGHLTTPDCTRMRYCLKCLMKLFIQGYWGATPLHIPISGSSQVLFNIQLAAWDTNLFFAYNQEDPIEFYRWIVGEMDDAENDRWHEDWESLFTMIYQAYETCQTCKNDARVRPVLQPQMMLEIPIQNPSTRTIREAIFRIFARDPVNSPCGSAQCRNQDRNKLRRLETKAAPRALIIKLKIYDNDEQKIVDNNGNLLQGPKVDERLDLTQYQAFDSVSLRYTLSSVISHNGPNIAIGQDVVSIRSHRGCTDRYWNIENTSRVVINRREFLSNPQNQPLRVNRYQVYILTYIRDEKIQDIENIERSRELRNLETTFV
ncbi:uncharacterized protein N0V89_009231 [Didymosphaeria variabile]|uniref:USP domain-containing protein n=1 Tax=Didymosphaeria variabile TaxID=1932322 RepID=A0A9W9C731_9PLEO|nr:uncharacterized protein N0V89_009231 [Didymosphaeria variabile]KAJ4347861.1 hypothetical protein N0V89_009231 [Didymosphaeria variabile]